ncbi:hypothetical protein [Paraburkholderia heleia]|uniref:hypothetical protein n=1 Tax=Paraburkholderia heleia TaxID=634127 RepID=UPI002AB71B35|nr:hypothetical protein [Paraburkholderia heleia]
MSSFYRRQLVPYGIAAALQAAWPCAVFAQNAPYGAATDSSPTAASAQSSQGDTPASPAQRQQSDEQRLLGGPRMSSGSPYSVTPYNSDGASPDDAEDALTNEKHMHVVTPGDYAASAAAANGGRGNDRSGASGRSGTSSRIGPNGRSRAGNAVARSSGGTPAGAHRSAAAGYDYGASATSPTAQVYGNPYASPYGSPDQSNAELYKSPW